MVAVCLSCKLYYDFFGYAPQAENVVNIIFQTSGLVVIYSIVSLLYFYHENIVKSHGHYRCVGFEEQFSDNINNGAQSTSIERGLLIEIGIMINEHFIKTVEAAKAR